MISSRFARWNLIGVSVALLIVFFWIDPNGSSATWARFIGRFHPGIVHLPVGFLFFGVILRVFRAPDAVTNVALVAGSWAAVVAVAAGSWLAQLGAYPPDTMFLHKLLGYGAAVLAAALLFARFELNKPVVTVPMWTLVVASLVVAGDLGGVLTRGTGYTTEYAPEFVQSLLGHPDPMNTRFKLERPDDVSVYDALIDPIFQEKCASCHGPERGKGRLRLHTAESIQNHSGDDPLIVEGRPSESLLVQRISLPEGHEDQMPPPPNAKPISHADVELIKWWIVEGASFTKTVAATPMTPEVQTILSAYGLGEIKSGIFALDIAPPDENLLTAFRVFGARIDALSIDSPFLSVKCAQRASCFEGEARAALLNIAPHVAALDASNSDIRDEDFLTIGSLPNLTRLDVSETDINGSGFDQLSSLEYLTYLNLFETATEDDALLALESMPELISVYLWQTEVSKEAITRLQNTLPDARINTGADSN